MKFVFLGSDVFLESLELLLQEGHECLKIFTFETDNQFVFNQRLLQFAKETNIPVQMTRVKAEDLEQLADEGCTLFLSAAYLYKIPIIKRTGAYGINIHPTLLPAGRGIWPTPYLVLDHPEHAGLTIHKLAADYDTGDILYQKPLPITNQDDADTITIRCQLALIDILPHLVKNIDQYWKGATKQDEEKASHWPAPSTDMRSIDLGGTCADIMKHKRAFGRAGCIVKLEDQIFWVNNFAAWKDESYKHVPAGNILYQTSPGVVLRCADGIVYLKDLFPVDETALG